MMLTSKRVYPWGEASGDTVNRQHRLRDEAVDRAHVPQDKVVVALRKGTESSGEDLKIIDMPDRDAVSEVFSNYEFDRIVYFSEDLTPRSERDGDLGYLRRLLHTVRNRKVQMLMVSGPESEFAYPQETDVHETSKA